MESAQHINAGLGAANLVEECKCPTGYEGLSCQKCSPGFIRESSGPWLGHCRREEIPCPAGTYGAPARGIPCQPCPCPLTNKENQFARTCNMEPDGSVTCDCMPGYEGRNCERCAPDFIGNPLMPGDICKARPSHNCNPVGTRNVRLPDQCECKNYAQGRFCDQCKEGSFFLSPDFVHGCAQCFCSGVTEQCTSSNLRRTTTSVDFNTPQSFSQVKLYSSTLSELSGTSRYSIPLETSIDPYKAIKSTSYQQPSTIYYWGLPPSFTGDKVTSYGGNLQYTIRSSTTPGAPRKRNGAPDVQLISENRLTFHFFANNPDISSDGTITVTVPFLEGKWLRPDGTEVQRQYLLLALADVKSLIVKASYWENTAESYVVSASIETAEPGGGGPEARHVEQCSCPTGYLGTSCEDCAPGYTRGGDGFYLQHCEPCMCNGHSNNCHPETGECLNCADNTMGPRCESCRPGYQNFSGICEQSGSSSTDCGCNPSGMDTCVNGNCFCKRNVEGPYCDRCRRGSFGLDISNRDGCLPCYCSGLGVECYEAPNYHLLPMPATVLGSDYGGYTITDLKGNTIINDQFVPMTEESELQYVFPFHPEEELYWSLPKTFSGNKILSYGGNLILKQRFESSDYTKYSTPGNDVILDGGNTIIAWSNPQQMRSGESLSSLSKRCQRDPITETAFPTVPLREDGWRQLENGESVDRNLFMSVLADLNRILVIAPYTTNVHSVAIADVSMDVATDKYGSGAPAKAIELCQCPAGYSGTSCETCVSGYYKDQRGRCTICPCNRHDCQLDVSGQVVCNCRPPYTGRDCSTIGLVMELLPVVEDGDFDALYRRITITCKYKAPEPLTIKVYYDDKEIPPPKSYKDSKLESDGWQDEHQWSTMWDTRRRGNIIECHTITKNGDTLGVLTSSLAQGTDVVAVRKHA
ncbi:Basement membrane-specific heparan sulfate proteoglycan core protein [Eumeta japonica]|uniref:Basement membrane-specific heparan sulfate proteoglycan core protein n=1 Tax=Eumeta variegata TaxID=151549 RepID=A0A4C1SVF1_EUMVA|nr:Basement membrane-specific heparan sulfate proteoglycan core protein [Eumeta japonica]